MTTEPKPRWFHLTPGRLLVILLIADFLLWLSEQFRWLQKGYPVLIALTVVGMALLILIDWFLAAWICRRFFPLRRHFVDGLWIVPILFVLSDRFKWLGFIHDARWEGAFIIVGLGLMLLALLLSLANVYRSPIRFQFSLRALLVLVVVVASPFSWLAVERVKARRQADAVTWVEEFKNATVLYDWAVDAKGNVLANAQPPAPPRIGRPLGIDFFTTVLRVSLANSEVSDADLDRLEAFPQLQELDLRHTKVTSDGAKRLQRALPRCQIIYDPR